MKQPMTATQLSQQTPHSQDTFSKVLAELFLYGLLRCLNPRAQRSRLYWLSELGKLCQQKLRETYGLSPLKHEFPEVDWEVYGKVCFSHRATVIRTLSMRSPEGQFRAMQPSEIRRRARYNDRELRMSANNVRDVIRVLRRENLVESVRLRGKVHVRYRLTSLGLSVAELLKGARRFGDDLRKVWDLDIVPGERLSE